MGLTAKNLKEVRGVANPSASGGLFGQNKNDAKTLKNDRKSGKWVLISEYSARAFQ